MVKPTKTSRASRSAKRNVVSTTRAVRNENTSEKEDRSRSPRRRGVSMPSAADKELEVHSLSEESTGNPNQNGQLIIQAIQNLNKVAKIEEILAQLKVLLGIETFPPGAVETIDYTLKKGVKYGIIQVEDDGFWVRSSSSTAAEDKLAIQPTPIVGKPTAVLSSSSPCPSNNSNERK